MSIKQENKHEEPNNVITYLNQYGNYQYIRYVTRTIVIDPIFTAPQKELSEKVISLYEKTNHVLRFVDVLYKNKLF